MYQSIYKALQVLSKGDLADLRRCSLTSLANAPAYFRILAYTQAPDNKQTQRILFLLLHSKISAQGDGVSVARALLQAGVKESQVIQLTRSGDNGIDYLKRQLVRCSNIDLESLGKLAQFWGDRARRELLKAFILTSADQFETESNELKKGI